MKEDKIEIYTDGSCYYKTKEGGWAFVITEDNKEIVQLGSGEIDTTSNRMELTAIIEAIEVCNLEMPNEDVIIYTDSKYCVNGYTKWMHKWHRNKWQGVKNKDLWKKLYENQGHEVKWVKGHADNKWNELADTLANYKNYL
jgi:ribonuclease HI